jgi:hypothetical protein
MFAEALLLLVFAWILDECLRDPLVAVKSIMVLVAGALLFVSVCRALERAALAAAPSADSSKQAPLQTEYEPTLTSSLNV